MTASQQIGCTGLDGRVHTMRLRPHHHLLYSPLWAKTNRSHKSHMQCERALNSGVVLSTDPLFLGPPYQHITLSLGPRVASLRLVTCSESTPCWNKWTPLFPALLDTRVANVAPSPVLKIPRQSLPSSCLQTFTLPPFFLHSITPTKHLNNFPYFSFSYFS